MEPDSAQIFLQTFQGKLMGKVFKDWNGSEYVGFLSIPYAKPPIGELRLKAPVEIEPWTTTLNATNDLPTCIHLSKHNKIVGTEDCLYLNVYTANLQKEPKQPVLVFIHGGGFIEGSGQMQTFGPDYMISEGLVIVAIQYRLGILGSLSTNDQSILPGNFGLKDQVMALKWVQKNISCFGGDPTNVTLMGQSAGAASVHAHMLSPMSTGLFHKVIMQSASMLCSWTLITKGSANVAAEKLKIKADSEIDMVNQLMKRSAEELTRTICAKMIMPLKHYINDCAPVVEEQNNTPKFLPSKPIDIIKSGRYNKVPMLIGFNSAESLFFDVLKMVTKSTIEKFDVFDLKNSVPVDVPLRHLESTRRTFAKKIRNFYFDGKEPERSKQTESIKSKILTDYEYKYPICKTIEEHLKSSDCHIYFYQFNMQTCLNLLKNAVPLFKDVQGVAHGEELNYFFKNSKVKIELGGVEKLCIKRVVKLWTNFIKSGNPTPEIDPLLDVNWLPATADRMNYLKIENDFFELEEYPSNDVTKFWDGIYKLNKNSNL